MKALIVDDERLARKELIKLLEEHPSIEIVGEAQNADEAEQMITELNPDLLLSFFFPHRIFPNFTE